MGLSRRAIDHRCRRGRLHIVFRGVYAVGRPEVSRQGQWTAAVLACGEDAVLSHSSAGAYYGFAEETDRIEVSVPRDVRRRDIWVHCRAGLAVAQVDFCDGIAVTTPAQTLADLALRGSSHALAGMVNDADNLDVIHWDELGPAIGSLPPTPGVARLRDWYARETSS
jgi:predicted transcriptional regulator of viral defense system